MIKTKEDTILDPRIEKAFAGVRGRVQAAVAAQPRLISLSDALAQVRKFQQLTATKK